MLKEISTMAEVIKYRKLEGSNSEYGIFNRNYMIKTCTEDDLRYTLDLCEKDLADGLGVGEYGESLRKLRASILEALNG